MKEAFIKSEHEASHFIEDYVSEMERVSRYFISKLDNLIRELEDLKTQYEYKRKTVHENSLNQSVMLFQSKIQHGEERDEFEYAISWKRAFTQIYIKVTWLNSFALTNSITS
jgi:hypothetical protein